MIYTHVQHNRETVSFDIGTDTIPVSTDTTL